ncbi:hypothetical protein J5069_14650 [Candidatus Symbiopectobacterium sp. NZEC127]|uniref:hypothetical protein n=1 Tax=Candidatus Symbiopectobacterium sp. NZEC127 TaxID=2820472 RepID=UPI002226C717|nr:hypothetical protein [Candidatus Symbiopectobacterium sp. NZEC127]MCW2487133.1 hypothetical protein [Candidatus Symbiopectobacterium sp. NZEC127]
MPIKFEPVDVNIFMSTYLSLVRQDRISHEALDNMGKVAKKIEFATNGIDLFKRMKIRDQHDVDKRLAPLHEKLMKQQSKHYDKKKEKLVEIAEALKKRVTKDPNVREHYISRYRNNQNQIKIEKSLIEKEILKHSGIRALNVDNADLFKHKREACHLQLNVLRDDDAETVIKKANDNLSETKKNVAYLYNQLREITHHAQKKMSDLDYVLRLAVDNKIYSAKDLGCGPTTWKSHLSADAYAKKYFGTQRVCGRRKHIEREIPSIQGKKWQSTLIDYCHAYAVLKEYQNALKKGTRDGVSLAERCRTALMKDIVQTIDGYDAKHSTYTRRAEKTAEHLSNLRMKSMICDTAINDVNRQIERVKSMGDS